MTQYTKKQILIVLVLLAVPLGGIGYLSVKAAARLGEEAGESVRLTTRMARAQVSQLLEVQRLLLRPLVRSLELDGGRDASATLQAWLELSRTGASPRRTLPWRQLLLVQAGPPGALPRIVGASSRADGIDPATTGWGPAFARAPGDPPLAVSDAPPARRIHVLAPARVGGRPAAVVAEASLEDLAGALADVDLPPSFRLYVLERQGPVLACLPSPTAVPDRLDLLAYEAQAGSPDGGTYRNHAGERVLGAHCRIPGTSWELLGEMDEARALGGARLITVKNRWLTLGLLLTVAFTALFASRSVTRPVSALSEAVKRVSEGDLSARVTIRTGDELEALGDGFNAMVANLQDLYGQMDRRVGERTRDLDHANRQLQDANRRLEEASRVKSQFLATMSHELRTPLNAIIGFSELMADEIPGPLNEDQKQCVDDVLDSGRHLLGLINDILDLSKIEAGRMELQRQPFNLEEMLGALVRNLQPLAERRRHALELEPPGPLPPIDADEGKVRQIVTNLVGNAIKFTPDGGRVTVRARREAAGFRIAVADTGVGISEEDRERVFEEFRQVDGSHTREQEGTGLGLALTRRLVALHGGEIGVESRLGEGSTFWFTLPDPAPGGAEPRREPETRPGPEPPTRSDPTRREE